MEKDIYYYHIFQERSSKKWFMTIDKGEQLFTIKDVINHSNQNYEHNLFPTLDDAKTYIKQIRKQKKYPYLRKRK